MIFFYEQDIRPPSKKNVVAVLKFWPTIKADGEDKRTLLMLGTLASVV